MSWKSLYSKILLIFVTIGFLTLTFWTRDRYVVPILTYHNVNPDHTKGMLNTVTPKNFAHQMKFIKAHGYNVISFEDLVDGMKRGRAFARNTVVIQFDDGYEDNYTYAFPVLKTYGFPAMVFLISDKVGKLGYLTWDQVKEMESYDFKAGAHTRNHEYLPNLSREQAIEEIAGSKKIIEKNLGHSIDYFCYPSGGFSDEVKGIVAESGYKAAVTTNRGKDRFNRDLYELKRVRAKDSDGAFVLWAKLSGYYNLFRKAKDGD
jgi:peptidoglycan/xylan/chitin deacetylase (PgdA/CDA1 family)